MPPSSFYNRLSGSLTVWNLLSFFTCYFCACFSALSFAVLPSKFHLKLVPCALKFLPSPEISHLLLLCLLLRVINDVAAENIQTVPSRSNSSAGDAALLPPPVPLLVELPASTALSAFDSATPDVNVLFPGAATPTMLLEEARRHLEGRASRRPDAGGKLPRGFEAEGCELELVGCSAACEGHVALAGPLSGAGDGHLQPVHGVPATSVDGSCSSCRLENNLQEPQASSATARRQVQLSFLTLSR